MIETTNFEEVAEGLSHMVPCSGSTSVKTVDTPAWLDRRESTIFISPLGRINLRAVLKELVGADIIQDLQQRNIEV